MKKVLFLIHDLGQGGAEKVLVNLVNNMDCTKFNITVLSLFGGGINEQFLNTNIRYLTAFKRTIRGNSKLMKLFTPKQLHNYFVKDTYDIEVSYLEGSESRIISGCCSSSTRLVSWVHGEQHTRKAASSAFRSEKEAELCYRRFDQHVFVAETVKEDFLSIFPQKKPCDVLYNTVESDRILSLAKESADEIVNDESLKIVCTGSLKKVKGFERLLRIIKRLTDEKYSIHLYILGKGPLRSQLEQYVDDNRISDRVTFLGYQTNPYKYVSKCDLFVCSSYREGFSTAATEALIVGTPVCTVEVSGMKEMLGANNEYGVITENNEEALYQGIKQLLENPELLAHYKKQAEIRGKAFSREKTVKAVEDMLLEL